MNTVVRTCALLVTIALTAAASAQTGSAAANTLAVAFPRETLAYFEARGAAGADRVLSADSLKKHGVSEQELQTLWAYAAQLFKGIGVGTVTADEARELVDGSGNGAVGVIDFTVAGIQEKTMPVQYLVVADHRATGTLETVLTREAAAGNKGITPLAPREKMSVFNINPRGGIKAIETRVDIGAMLAGTLVCVDGKWAVYSNLESRALSAAEALIGVVPADETLAGSRSFKDAVGEITPATESVVYLGIAEAIKLASKVENVAKAMAEWDVSGMRALGAASVFDPAKRESRTRGRLSFERGIVPGWYQPLAGSARDPVLLHRMQVGKNASVVWMGMSNPQDRINKLRGWIEARLKSLEEANPGAAGADAVAKGIPEELNELASMLDGEALMATDFDRLLKSGAGPGDLKLSDIDMWAAFTLKPNADSHAAVALLARLSQMDPSLVVTDTRGVTSASRQGITFSALNGLLVAGTDSGVSTAIVNYLNSTKSTAALKPASLIIRQPAVSIASKQIAKYAASEPWVAELASITEALSPEGARSEYVMTFTASEVTFEGVQTPVAGAREFATALKRLLSLVGTQTARAKLSRIHAGLTLFRALDPEQAMPQELAELVALGLVKPEDLVDGLDAGQGKGNVSSFVYTRPPAGAQAHERYAIAWHRDAWLPGAKRSVLYLDGSIEVADAARFEVIQALVLAGKPVAAE